MAARLRVELVGQGLGGWGRLSGPMLHFPLDFLLPLGWLEAVERWTGKVGQVGS